MSREPLRPISRAIAAWLLAMGDPGYDTYDLHALERYLALVDYPTEAIETELQLWLRWYMRPISPGSRGIVLSPEGQAVVRRLRQADRE